VQKAEAQAPETAAENVSVPPASGLSTVITPTVTSHNTAEPHCVTVFDLETDAMCSTPRACPKDYDGKKTDSTARRFGII
jgi:hypothetical protein